MKKISLLFSIIVVFLFSTNLLAASDTNSRDAIIAQQAPEKVYDLLTNTPETTFKTKTDANPGRQVPLSSIDIPNSDTNLQITTIIADQFPRWANTGASIRICTDGWNSFIAARAVWAHSTA